MPALSPRAGETLLLLSGHLWPALTPWLRRAQGATSARASLGLLSFPPFSGHVGSVNFGSFQLVDPVAARRRTSSSSSPLHPFEGRGEKPRETEQYELVGVENVYVRGGRKSDRKQAVCRKAKASLGSTVGARLTSANTTGTPVRRRSKGGASLTATPLGPALMRAPPTP